MQVSDAIDVLARRLIADLVANDANDRWESYPDIGEQDWKRIVARAHALAETPAEYAGAYEVFVRRAWPSCTADDPPCGECREGHA